MSPAVLLVDVASVNREELKSFLRNQNCDVVTSQDSESAVTHCRQLQPDLVLLFDTLPDTSSFELCRRLKKDPLNQLTPVVLLKPSPDQWDIHRGKEAGASDIWANPSSLWDTLQRIQTLLRLKSYMDEQAKSALFSLARSVDSKQNLRNGHSELLLTYAEQLGKSLGLEDEDILELRIACWLHDVGKFAVPQSILLKPGPLDAAETQIVREHPIIGEKICAPLKSLRPILPVIRHHHEKMDGSGYPDGLRGESIPLKARILQVADIYDALTTDRPYREALPHNEALSILFAEVESGWLDPTVVSHFARISRGYQYFPVRGRTMLASYYA
ncbi:MAG TPA: HD domain-containing phosphohydrolase [Candidatus Acidoferrales bacterium]|jgi:putative two-component system response regulator|nr:HD domain-containing phosphohydrolase [Candidatus Acidoferrales bacterium]